MTTKVCPNCGWRKDISTEVCHCGYDFVSGKMGTPEPSPTEATTDNPQALETASSAEKAEITSDAIDTTTGSRSSRRRELRQVEKRTDGSENATEAVPASKDMPSDDDSSTLNNNLAYIFIGYLFGYLIPALFVLFGRGFSFDIQIFANPFVVPGALLGWIGGRMGGYAGAVAAGIICGIVLFVVLIGLTSA